MSRGDEEIIDDALDMLAWQRMRLAVLEEALRKITDIEPDADNMGRFHDIARAALGETE